jgi:hypothetical protein
MPVEEEESLSKDSVKSSDALLKTDSLQIHNAKKDLKRKKG